MDACTAVRVASKKEYSEKTDMQKEWDFAVLIYLMDFTPALQNVNPLQIYGGASYQINIHQHRLLAFVMLSQVIWDITIQNGTIPVEGNLCT